MKSFKLTTGAAILVMTVLTSCRQPGEYPSATEEYPLTETAASSANDPKDPPKDVPKDRDNWKVPRNSKQ